jgi:Cu+-exporting ATPase
MSNKVVMTIDGMHCTSCASLIELNLMDEDGVRAVEVDYPLRRATVEFDPARQSISALTETIEGLGYKVTDRRDSP